MGSSSHARKPNLSGESAEARAGGFDYEDALAERFARRVRTLFYARLALLAVGLAILSIPAWARFFGATSVWASAWYVFMLAYGALNYMVADKVPWGRRVTFLTLNLDLLVVLYLIGASGAMRSPVLPTQLVFTVFFALLFPRPLAILPPLLTLPVVAKIDQILYDRPAVTQELFVLVWFSVLNFILVYVIIYLDQRETAQQRRVWELQLELKRAAVVEERARIARELHDGIGANLSGLLLQAQYATRVAGDEKTRAELVEIEAAAQEGIDEVRRCVSMMREDFDLASTVEDFCRTFADRSRIPVSCEISGKVPALSPDSQLSLFRVLQESLTNVARHAEADKVEVELASEEVGVGLKVKDNGVGFVVGVQRTGHYGLASMHERVKKIGGDLRVESGPGGGTTVALRIPTEEGRPEREEETGT